MLSNIIKFVIVIFCNFSFSQTPLNERDIIAKSYQLIADYSDNIFSNKSIDTTFSINILHIEKYFDKDNNLIKRVTTKPNSSLGISGPRTEIYDVNGNLIVAKNQDFNGEIWYLAINEYDNAGNLVKTIMFDMNHIYTQVYEYDMDKMLLKTRLYNAIGKEVKAVKKTKRKFKYKIK